jgi:hypothetical protein
MPRRFPLPAFAAVLGISLLALPGPVRAQNASPGPVTQLSPLPQPPVLPGQTTPAVTLPSYEPPGYVQPYAPLMGAPGGTPGTGFKSSLTSTPYQNGSSRPVLRGQAPPAGMPPYYGPPGPGMPYAPFTSAYGQMPGKGYGGTATSTPYANAPGVATLKGMKKVPEPPTATAEETALVEQFLPLVHEDSGLDWPLALRILPPGLEATRLRQEIDQQAKDVREAADRGLVDANAFPKMRHALAELHRLYDERAGLLPVSHESVEEGYAFLHKLQKALR